MAVLILLLVLLLIIFDVRHSVADSSNLIFFPVGAQDYCSYDRQHSNIRSVINAQQGSN